MAAIKHMVKLLKKEFDILHLKHKGQRWTKGTTNVSPVNDIQKQKYQAPTERDNILSGKPQTERWRAGGWPFAGWIQGAKGFGKTQLKMVEATVQLGAILKGRNATEALKEAYEELKENVYGEENITCDPCRRQRPICIVILCWLRVNLIVWKRIGDKKKSRTQEKFLEAMQERVPRAKFARLEPRKTI